MSMMEKIFNVLTSINKYISIYQNIIPWMNSLNKIITYKKEGYSIEHF